MKTSKGVHVRRTKETKCYYCDITFGSTGDERSGRTTEHLYPSFSAFGIHKLSAHTVKACAECNHTRNAFVDQAHRQFAQWVKEKCERENRRFVWFVDDRDNTVKILRGVNETSDPAASVDGSAS